jgi:hypothetical protein
MTWLFWRLIGIFRWPFLSRSRWRQEWGTCPWCGDRHQDWLQGNLFKRCAYGVQSGTADGPPVHWAEGVQTCRRCWYRFYVHGSS